MSINIQGSAYKDFSSALMIGADITKPAQSDKPVTPLASIKVSDVKEEKKGFKGALAGISIGLGAILTVLVVAGLSKGTSGSFYKKLRKYSADLKRKTFDMVAQGKKLTLNQKIKLKMAKVMKPVTTFLEGSANINVFKDGGTLFLLKKAHAMPVVKRINNFFRSIVMKTKTARYRNAEMANVRFCNYLESLGKKTDNPAIKEFAKNVSNSYSNTFSTQRHYQRAQDMWNSLDGLHNRVWNSFNVFKKEKNIFAKENRSRLHSYITMDMSAKERENILNVLKTKKKLISNNIADNYSSLRDALDDLKVFVNPKDKQAVELTQNLAESIEKYNKLSGAKEASERSALSEKMIETLDSLKLHFKNTEMSAIKEHINEFKNILNPERTKKGEVQEALTFIKEKFGKESVEYKTAKKYANEFNSKLNKAISTESTAYEKFAELQMGSAPTDILGLLGPAALGTFLVIRAKDKDKRITNTLTQGIPIIGGIATAYYGTTRMLTGPTNMALGLISGALLSIIGAKVDDLRKAYKVKSAKFKQEYEAMKLASQKYREMQKADEVK